MRLICELCEERNLPAIINIHDVLLAQMFAKRIVGLQFGAVVYDGPPEGLDDRGSDPDLRRGGLVGDDPEGRRRSGRYRAGGAARPELGPGPPGGRDLTWREIAAPDRVERRWKRPPLMPVAGCAGRWRSASRSTSRPPSARSTSTGFGSTTACRAARPSSRPSSRRTSPRAGTRSRTGSGKPLDDRRLDGGGHPDLRAHRPGGGAQSGADAGLLFLPGHRRPFALLSRKCCWRSSS